MTVFVFRSWLKEDEIAKKKVQCVVFGKYHHPSMLYFTMFITFLLCNLQKSPDIIMLQRDAVCHRHERLLPSPNINNNLLYGKWVDFPTNHCLGRTGFTSLSFQSRTSFPDNDNRGSSYYIYSLAVDTHQSSFSIANTKSSTGNMRNPAMSLTQHATFYYRPL